MIGVDLDPEGARPVGAEGPRVAGVKYSSVTTHPHELLQQDGLAIRKVLNSMALDRFLGGSK